MARKKAAAAEKDPTLESELFGDIPPEPQIEDVVEEPEPEPEPELETPEPEEEPEADVEPEAEPAEEEPEGEEAEAAESGDEDGEPARETSAPARQGLPATALKELQKLRRERAEARRQQQPAPIIPPSAAPSTLPEGAVGLDRLPVNFDDDGKPYLDLQQLQGVVGKMVEPSPQQQAQYELQTAEQAFVNENPELNAPAVARVRAANEYLQLRSQQLEEDIGYAPQGIESWVQALDEGGVTEEFQQHFPEITDIGRFVHATFGGDITTLRYYMDDYVKSVYADSESEEVPATPAREQKVVPKVVPLPKGRPRSMAQKGSSSDSEEATSEARHAQLMKLAQADPISFSEENQSEMTRLAKKLGIED